jgi:2-keto-4-pentenoate hydratase/2-oxohepta-3-ene-1,7-dioic acid hydratase in catechol pathway
MAHATSAEAIEVALLAGIDMIHHAPLDTALPASTVTSPEQGSARGRHVNRGRGPGARGHGAESETPSKEHAMRIANLSGRLVLIDGDRAVDVERASEGLFRAEPQAVYPRWEEFRAWAQRTELPAGRPFEHADLGSPAPEPAQALGIGLNYRDHAGESGFEIPEGLPPVFTKFRSSLSGPITEVRLPEGGHTDWEVELVAVIGREARDVAPWQAWSHVAGLAVGQDISERILQLQGPAPQFSLGKSFPGFGPVGPWLVTPDEFADPDDLALSCSVNGEQVQKSRTGELIFPVPELVSRLSAVLTLYPGDVIFTGTPAGVGLGRNPQRWLAPGDVLISEVEGIGRLRQRFIA